MSGPCHLRNVSSSGAVLSFLFLFFWRMHAFFCAFIFPPQLLLLLLLPMSAACFPGTLVLPGRGILGRGEKGGYGMVFSLSNRTRFRLSGFHRTGA